MVNSLEPVFCLLGPRDLQVMRGKGVALGEIYRDQKDCYISELSRLLSDDMRGV